MPYYITKTNGDALVTIEDGTVNTTATDLTLLGKNYPTYGLSLNQNFVKLLENFAGTDQPGLPLLGQLWYDSTNKSLFVYREGSIANDWTNLSVIYKQNSEPADVIQGDLWFDIGTNQLKIYNGGAWVTVGPQTTSTGLLRVTGTNTFVLQIGGTDVFTVDAAGNVSKPFNPILQAFGRSGGSDFSTSNLTSFATWVPGTVAFDSASAFDGGTGVYTCPVPGYYKVFFSCTTQTSGAHIARWQVNEVDYGINAANSHTAGEQNMTCCGIIEAAAGDEIKLVCATDAGATISYQNANYSIEFIG